MLLKIIKRTIQLLTRLGALIEAPDQTYFAETDTKWGAVVAAGRLVHLSYHIALGLRTWCMQWGLACILTNDPIEFFKVSPQNLTIDDAAISPTRRADETTNLTALQAGDLGKFASRATTNSRDSQLLRHRVITFRGA